MSKNKRYKRLAKRMKGYCINRTDCFGCKYDNMGYCDGVYCNTELNPFIAGIRTIERICKYGK